MALTPYLCAASASVPTGTIQKQPWVFFAKSFHPTSCIFRDYASRNGQPRVSVGSLYVDLVPTHCRKPPGCDHSSPSFLEVLQELSRCPSFYRAPNNHLLIHPELEHLDSCSCSGSHTTSTPFSDTAHNPQRISARRRCCSVEMIAVLARPCPMLYSTMRLQISVETAVDFAFSPPHRISCGSLGPGPKGDLIKIRQQAIVRTGFPSDD